MRRSLKVLAVVRDALRTHRGSAVLILAAGAITLAGVLPVARLARSIGSPDPRLEYNTVRTSDLGFHWGSNAMAPADAQSQTIGFLFQLLLVAAFATFILAATSILSISAARASTRRPEIAVRRAVGASRRDLRLAAFAEGGAIGSMALVLGIGAGALGLAAALAGWPGKVGPGSSGLALLAMVIVAAIIIAGALFQLLSAPRRVITEANPQPLELVIPALQLGMGLTVLVASTMLVRQAERLVEARATSPNNGVVYELATSDSVKSRAGKYQSLLDELHRRPGIETASLMSPGALVGLGMSDAITTDCGFCPDGGVVIKWHVVFATHHFVSADTFEALGIARIEGRLFSDRDRLGSPPVVVISRSLAQRHFQNGEAIGRQVLLKLDRPEWYTVVGVVDDRSPEGFGGEAQPRSTIYLSVLQHPPSSVDLLLRASHGTLPVDATHLTKLRFGTAGTSAPMDEAGIVAREAQPLAWFGRWFSILGWVMLLLTTGSTFVLMRQWVRSLRSELGVRRAVGARRIHLMRYVLGRALMTALGGLIIAVWFGPALWDSLPEMVAGLPAWSVPLVAPLALLQVGIAVAGALLPARRALAQSPATLIGSVGE